MCLCGYVRGQNSCGEACQNAPRPLEIEHSSWCTSKDFNIFLFSPKCGIFSSLECWSYLMSISILQ